MADNTNLQDVIEIKVEERDKKFLPEVESRSVVVHPDVKEGLGPHSSLVLQFAEIADEFVPWGTRVAERDNQLRGFWKVEPFMASAVYSASARNASFEWEIVNADPRKAPHKTTIRKTTHILEHSDRGNGWDELIKKTSVDLYTQDNGAFWELIRTHDSPVAAVLNVAHIDANRCRRTGDPRVPVVYTDMDGRERELKWYHIAPMAEFPAPEEDVYGLQVCAVSRALRAVQIMRDIGIYKHEKIAGRHAGAMHLIGGVQKSAIEEVEARHAEKLNNLGMMRYSPPMIFSAIDPTKPVSHVQVDLASLPDGYDEQTTFQWYLAQLALSFGVDYQEFAPLPSTQGLGSSQQSEILHMKTRGKGPATIMKLIERTINNSGILPKTVKFQFKVQDMRAEEAKARASFDRGKDRALRIQSGELDLESAIHLAWEDGDLPEHIFRQRLENIRTMQEEAPPVTGEEEVSITQVRDGSDAHNES